MGCQTIPHDILKYGIQDGFSSTSYHEFELDYPVEHETSLQGTWSGHCSQKHREEVIPYVLRISIRVQTDPKKIWGKGEDYTDAFEFTGDVDPLQGSSIKFAFKTSDDTHWRTRFFSGFLDTDLDVITAHWSTNENLEEDEPNQIFRLRRIPPTLLRYRYKPDQFEKNPVRSRWSFACSAALHQAQEKLRSRSFVEARFSERKRFVELLTRGLIVQMGLTPQSPLSNVERGELEYFLRNLNPSEARFYYALAKFKLQGLPWHLGVTCDSCGRKIMNCRILCIQCILEDLADGIDMCATCIDKVPIKPGFTHQASHPVVKTEQVLHDYELSHIVFTARRLFDRTKARFRSIESASIRIDGHDTASQQEAELACACCGKGVSPPCWACVVCSPSVFVCAECDSKRATSMTEAHRFSHPLVKIHDTLLDHDSKATSADNIFMGIKSKISDIETKIEQRFSQIESSLETRFVTLEALLRQIAGQNAAFPAVDGQVLRDDA